MNSHSLILLRSQHRRAQWQGPLWIVVLGLGLELAIAAWGVGAEAQLALLGLILALAVSTRVWPRRTLHDTAQALDAWVKARNRFEAVVEIGPRTDPLAGALRAEADRYLTEFPLPPNRGWFAGVLLFLVLLPVTLVHLGGGWLKTARGPESAGEAPQRSASAESTKPELKWITPSEDIAALASDVLPLTAEGKSSFGLQRVSLHIQRNGEALQPIALPAEIAAGTQRVSTPLRLPDLALQSFDIVSYFLRAEPRPTAGRAPQASISSPLQFVQILSEEEARLAGACSNCTGGSVLEIVRRLKREQQAIVRDMATVAHNAPAAADSMWTNAVSAIEAREIGIHDETEALIPMLVEAELPHAAIEALLGAKQETASAVTELNRGAPELAMPHAARALARFAAAEKELAKNIVAGNRRTPPEVQPRELPPRERTPAGRLEILASQQGTLAEQIASRPVLATAVTDQERLAREITQLASERALPNPVNDQVRAAGETAKESARQLAAEDPIAATEPATRTAQTLAEAAAQLNAAGRTRAADELLAAQRALIRAGTELRQAEYAQTTGAAKTAARRVAEIQAEARAAAQRQQVQGSAEAARRLLALGNAIRQSAIEQDLSQLAAQNLSRNEQKVQAEKDAAAAKILHLAQQAADVAAEFQHTSVAQARALEELRSTQANLERARDRAATSGNPGRDPAGIVGLYEDALRNAQRLAGIDSRERGLPPPPGPGAPRAEWHEYAVALSRRLDGLLRLALAVPAGTERQQVLTFGNPNAAPPAYRAAVADYFETLARDATPSGKP